MDYIITGIYPIRNRDICPSGGIIIHWAGSKGFGQLVLAWDEKGNLIADTERMADNEDKAFLKEIFMQLVDKIEVIE